ncbi:hypothetical protein ACFLQP_01690 [Acidobacteriota bacterium]
MKAFKFLLIFVLVLGLTAVFAEVGEPTLPIASRLISIPFDCSLKVEFRDTTSHDIDLKAYDLTDPFMPVQPPLSKSQHPDAAHKPIISTRFMPHITSNPMAWGT